MTYQQNDWPNRQAKLWKKVTLFYFRTCGSVEGGPCSLNKHACIPESNQEISSRHYSKQTRTRDIVYCKWLNCTALSDSEFPLETLRHLQILDPVPKHFLALLSRSCAERRYVAAPFGARTYPCAEIRSTGSVLALALLARASPEP